MTDAKRCPKCGGEMEYAIGKKGTIAEGIEEWYCPTCGFIDGEDECGHEEKVESERLAEAHWAWLGPLLEHIYLDAFEHGFGHGAEWATKKVD